MASYSVLRVVDLRTLVEHTFTVGERQAVLDNTTGFSIGSDPSCDVILPAAPSKSKLTGASNHRFIQTPDDEMRRRVDFGQFQLGAYLLQYSELNQPVVGLPPKGLEIRFGPRGLGNTVGKQPQEIDPRAAEQYALFQQLLTTPKLTAVDTSIAEDLREHLARLSRVTAPRAPLVPGFVRYDQTVNGAKTRFLDEWRYPAIAPVIASAYAYVHRVAVWESDFTTTHERHLQVPLALALVEHGWNRQLAVDVERLVERHVLATRLSLANPWEPLLALAMRGVHPYALPDAGFVCVMPALVDKPDELDDEVLARDPAVRADLLEQRGEHTRAARVRANQIATERPRVVPVHRLFRAAGGVIFESPDLEERPSHTATSVPSHITLETKGGTFALTTATTELVFANGALAINGTAKAQATLVYDGDILYLRSNDIYTTLNGQGVARGIDYLVFDHDDIKLGSNTNNRIAVRINDAAASDRA
ncbi:MAG: hypothetical protein QM831_27465 [Kofleriaceae bacterium]